MVLGRREISAIVLAFGALLFYLVLLMTRAPEAQVQPNEGCPNPQVVETFTGSQNQRTPTFNITGTSYQLVLEAQPVQSGQFASVSIESFQSNGTFVPFGNLDISPLEGPTTERTNVLEGPGSFYLEIESTNAQYTVTVADCGGGGGTIDGGDTVVDDNIIEDDIIEENVVTPSRKKQPTNIINIPKKPLPPSGGPPLYGVIASFILAGMGLLALGIGIRRGLRR